jgi:outer membrane protein OmpA-like peptidoglycan-associated protein
MRKNLKLTEHRALGTGHLLTLFLCVLVLAGCHKAPPAPRPVPSPVPTPIPARDRVVYVRQGALYAMHPAEKVESEIYGRDKVSIWFPEAIPGTDQMVAWVSRPDGSQNVARIWEDGGFEMLTDLGDRPLPAMKNLRLGNAPVPNPRGDKIAFSFNGDIWIMDTDGYDATTLIADHASWSPAWSPDGRKLAYVNGPEGHTNLWVTDVEDRDTYQVTDFEEFSVGHPRWAASGKTILFTKIQKDTSQLAQVPVPVDQPLVDSSPLTKGERAAGANFSPDGEKIVFSDAADDPLGQEIFLADADGKNAVRLTQGGGFSPTWLHPTHGPEPTPLPRALPTSTPASDKSKAGPGQTQPSAPEGRVALTPGGPEPTPEENPPFLHVRPQTQNPKAAALKVSLSLRFRDGSDNLAPESVRAVEKLADRAGQYRHGNIRIRGPLDASALEGHFSGVVERSLARAQAVRHVLAAKLGVAETQMEAVPYTPMVLGAAEAPLNGLMIQVEMK